MDIIINLNLMCLHCFGSFHMRSQLYLEALACVHHSLCVSFNSVYIHKKTRSRHILNGSWKIILAVIWQGHCKQNFLWKEIVPFSCMSGWGSALKMPICLSTSNFCSRCTSLVLLRKKNKCTLHNSFKLFSVSGYIGILLQSSAWYTWDNQHLPRFALG